MSISITLHIGTPKTGSTSLQQLIAVNSNLLESQGIHSCHELGGQNHVDLFLACLHPNEGGYGILEARGILGEQQRQQFKDQVASTVRAIAASARSRSENTILLATSEYFWFLHSEVHFRRLTQIFADADVKLNRLIVYFRHQAELLNSALSTMVRDGFAVNQIRTEMLEQHEFQYLKYHERLLNWIHWFPGVEVNAYPYNQHNQDLLEHFMAVLGVKSFEKPKIDRLNCSLSDFAIDLLSHLNARTVGDLSISEELARVNASPDRARLLSILDRLFIGQPSITPELVVAIDSYCAAENKALFGRFMPGVDYETFLLKKNLASRPLDRSNYPPQLVALVAELVEELMNK